MTDSLALREFLFKGLAIEALLDDMESEGVGIKAASDPGALQRVMPIEEFSAQIRRSAMKTLPAYLAFFCLENAVRELVADRLSENHGANWWDSCATLAIKTRVEQRRAKEGKNRWHIQRGAQELSYTDFGDLLTMIQKNWPDFEDLFPDQHWIANRLNDLEASRNIIAHTNVLDERELGRIRMYMQDWLKQVG